VNELPFRSGTGTTTTMTTATATATGYCNSYDNCNCNDNCLLFPFNTTGSGIIIYNMCQLSKMYQEEMKKQYNTIYISNNK